MKKMVVSTGLVLLVIGIIGSLGCLGKSQPSVEEESKVVEEINKPSLPVGTVWVFEINENGKTGKLVAARISENTIRHEGWWDRLSYLDDKERMTEMMVFTGDTKTDVKFSPPLEGISYPLTTSKKWKSNTNMEINTYKANVSIGSGQGTLNLTGEVIGFKEFTFGDVAYNCAEIKINKKSELRMEMASVGEVISRSDENDYGLICPDIGEVKFTINTKTLNKYNGQEVKEESTIEMTLESIEVPK